MFGKPADTLIGTSFVDYLDDDGIAQSMALHDRLIEHPDEPVPTEFNVLDGDGWRWIEATWTNQLHEPAVSGFVGNLRDITDRKRANAFGSDETRVFELILSGAPVPETLHDAGVRARDLHPRRRGIHPAARSRDRRCCESRRGTEPPCRVRGARSASTRPRATSTAFLSATETRVLTDIEHEGARADLNALCLAHGLRGHVVGAHPLSRRLRVPRAVRLLPAHRP